MAVEIYNYLTRQKKGSFVCKQVTQSVDSVPHQCDTTVIKPVYVALLLHVRVVCHLTLIACYLKSAREPSNFGAKLSLVLLTNAGIGVDASMLVPACHSSPGDDTAYLVPLNIIHSVLQCGSPGATSGLQELKQLAETSIAVTHSI